MVFRAAVEACSLGLLASLLSFAFAFGLQEGFPHESSQESGRIALLAFRHHFLGGFRILLSILLFPICILGDLFQCRDFTRTKGRIVLRVLQPVVDYRLQLLVIRHVVRLQAQVHLECHRAQLFQQHQLLVGFHDVSRLVGAIDFDVSLPHCNFPLQIFARG